MICLIVKLVSEKAQTVLCLFAIVSFALNIFTVYEYPKFAFYFPLCRFWEMTFGGILAYTNLRIQNSKINNYLSIAGHILIITGIWSINEKSLFPGWWAIVPTLGSVLIIGAGPKAWINKNVLSNKIMVFIGKISYPLYLWHWPCLVYSKMFYSS